MKQQNPLAERLRDFAIVVLIAAFFMAFVIASVSVLADPNTIILRILYANRPDLNHHIIDAFALILLLLSLYGLHSMIPGSSLVLRRLTLWKQLAAPANHGNTIPEVVENIRNETCEYCAIFSPDGDKISEWTSFSQRYVDLDPQEASDLLKTPGYIMVHNHPSHSTAFSPADIAKALQARFSKCIVVAQGATYEIELSESSWAHSQDTTEQECEQLYKQLRDTVGPFAAAEQLFEISLEFNRQAAAKYGYIFRFKDFDTSYYARNHR